MAQLIQNKKVLRDVEVLEHFEAGIELKGYEVKSIRAGNGSLDGAYIVVRAGEAFLVKMHIGPYQPKNQPENYDPEKTRRLLLSKKEIRELADNEKQKGLTLVPLSMYNKKGLIKVDCALVRGKKETRQARITQEERSAKRYAPYFEKRILEAFIASHVA